MEVSEDFQHSVHFSWRFGGPIRSYSCFLRPSLRVCQSPSCGDVRCLLWPSGRYYDQGFWGSLLRCLWPAPRTWFWECLQIYLILLWRNSSSLSPSGSRLLSKPGICFTIDGSQLLKSSAWGNWQLMHCYFISKLHQNALLEIDSERAIFHGQWARVVGVLLASVRTSLRKSETQQRSRASIQEGPWHIKAYI